jgi:ABC-2 type transport system ATP-binding protein
MTAPILCARALGRRYGDDVALEHLDLDVMKGDSVALLGPNGAGKTTALHLFLGFVAASSGSAEVCGARVSDDPVAARRHLGYLPEQLALYPLLTGRENLQYLAGLGGVELGDAEARRVLAEAGIDSLAAERRVRTYSKGMRQKVGLAIARVRRAAAVLLDEPLSGLDPEAATDTARMLRQMRDAGTALLLATHDLARVGDIAGRVLVLRGGRVLAAFATEGLAPGEIERRYLEAMNDA